MRIGNRITRVALPLVAAGVGVMLSGCYSANSNAAISRLWICYALGEHQRVIESSWAILADKDVTPEDRCACLFLRGDSLRQLQRYAEARASLGRIAPHSEVFWLDRDFAGKLALDPQLRLSRALSELEDTTAFPISESEHINVMLAWYGKKDDPRADEVARACAGAWIAKSEAVNRTH
jgi:hypothetical protein